MGCLALHDAQGVTGSSPVRPTKKSLVRRGVNTGPISSQQGGPNDLKRGGDCGVRNPCYCDRQRSRLSVGDVLQIMAVPLAVTPVAPSGEQ